MASRLVPRPNLVEDEDRGEGRGEADGGRLSSAAGGE